MQTKSFTNQLLPVVILFFVFTSCGEKTEKSASSENASTEKTFDLAATRKQIDEGNQALSDLLKKGDSTGFANMYCIDAKVMGPNGPAIVGRDAIKSAIGGMYRSGLTGLSLKPVDTWGSETLVAEEGTYVFSLSEGKEIDHGKYIVLWKMEDGKWKLFRDIWNTDIPMPASK
jgi:uncharacterized protein (TIGR02246 family)